MPTTAYRKQVRTALGARLAGRGLTLLPEWGAPLDDDDEDDEVVNGISHEHRRAFQVYEASPPDRYFKMFGEGALPLQKEQIDLLCVTVRDAMAAIDLVAEIYRAWLVDLKPRAEIEALLERHAAEFA